MAATRHITSRKVDIETRADGGKKIVGYGAVFYREGDAGTEYRLWSDMVERIKPQAFDRALSEGQDVRGLFNHESARILGRTASGTMRLSVDSVGLKYEIDLPDTQEARDLATLIARGDITGSSFAFGANKTEWEDRSDGLSIRSLVDVDLYDVGPVTYPAYEATSTAVRSAKRDFLISEREQYRKMSAAAPNESQRVDLLRKLWS